jgi:hypothetical protein
MSRWLDWRLTFRRRAFRLTPHFVLFSGILLPDVAQVGKSNLKNSSSVDPKRLPSHHLHERPRSELDESNFAWKETDGII